MSAQEVGQKLKQTREARGIELSEAARATRIRSHYLRALEEGDFGALPSPAQVRGFLRTYAQYLELDVQELFALLQPAASPTPPQEQPSLPSEAPPDVFAAIGATLRQRRESLQLTLPEIEQSTRIPEHYVQRLERGEFDSFPSPTQARGMLGNYADFLGLESEALLLQYAEGLQQRFQAKQAAKPTKPKRQEPKLVFRMPPWLAPLLSRDILFGAVAGLLLLIFVAWSIGRIAAARASQGPEPTAPPLTNLLLATQAPDASQTVLAATPGSINLLAQQSPTPGLLGESTIQVSSFGGVSLRLISLARTWMRVTVDGQVQFEGRTLPGQTYTYNAAGQILLLSGNGAALRAFLNEQDLGILGIYGEVVNITFSPEGAATPTLSPTPTIDPGILTATANAALTPSATPSPPPTATVDSGAGNP